MDGGWEGREDLVWEIRVAQDSFVVGGDMVRVFLCAMLVLCFMIWIIGVPAWA